MAKKPNSVEIRAYQVGFGDCFLVSFVYSKTDKRHVLIDFGTTALPKWAGKRGDHMKLVADHIQATCGGKLTGVVATHRHADHISGFATDNASGGSGQVIAQCNPDVVVQPWTEDPDAARDATAPTKGSSRSSKGFIAGLNAMHHVAEQVSRVASKPPPTMSAATAKQLKFLGEDNIKNKSAVTNLMAMGKRTKAVWASHGSDSGLEGAGLLEGVKVTVLGPPTLKQTEKIRKMRSSDPDQFWQLVGGRGVSGMNVADIDGAGKGKGGLPVPAEARWFRDRVAKLTSDELLEIVRVLDDQMNNTSLILLFEVGGRKLLFPGDAQIENWTWALADAPDAAKTRKLLADVDFYKVGHHGSRNATPKTLLWENFSNRTIGKKKSMKTALSTMKGKHGTPRKRTEVPRKTLLDALKAETDLCCHTDGFRFKAAEEPCQLVTIKV